jgi:hypothetical protein
MKIVRLRKVFHENSSFGSRPWFQYRSILQFKFNGQWGPAYTASKAIIPIMVIESIRATVYENRNRYEQG